MVLDQKIQKVKEYFGVSDLTQWNTVRPEWITAIDGIGQATLDQIRLHLAARGQTLLNDRTPEYWKAKLGTVRSGQVMADAELSIVNPFTIIVDTMEQLPFTFQGIASDHSKYTADIKWRISQGLAEPADITLTVPIEWRALGESRGDYSILDHQGRCHIERKSVDDAHGTILGWGERRERFERELEFLGSIECAAVVVEGSFGQVLAEVKARGKKSIDENRKTLHRQVLAWQQDYRVPWVFCDNRRLAEITTFRMLDRYWRKSGVKVQKEIKEAQQVLAGL